MVKRETVILVLSSIREWDWMASSSLKDAYFQILSHKSSRKIPWFFSRGLDVTVPQPMLWTFHRPSYERMPVSVIFILYSLAWKEDAIQYS